MNTHCYTSRQRFAPQLWLATALFAVLIAVFTAYAWSEKEIDRANDLRHQSFLLAAELRQSSDDLTRMARTYVVTHDARYKAAYEDILDIRDGNKPRPPAYHNVYWDLVLTHGKTPPDTGGESVALLSLMQQAGFTAQELAQLAQAKANSDQLTATELAAMQLVDVQDDQAPARQAQAALMLHDDAYHAAKAAIMLPIKAFYAQVDLRTQQAVESAKTLALVLRVVFILFSLSLMSMLLRARRLLRSILGGTLDEVFVHITQIGQGELETPIAVAKRDQDSVLGWLAHTQASLKTIQTERQQALVSSAQSEAHLRTLIEAEPECIKIVDARGQLTQMNPAGLAMIEADSFD